MISDNYVVGDNAYLKELQNFFFEVLGMMSITHYGCIGDGRTDNYGPLQVAIDDAKRRGLSFLYVPYGRFIYTGELNNLEGLTFMGNPHSKIVNIRTGVEQKIYQFGWQGEFALEDYFTREQIDRIAKGDCTDLIIPNYYIGLTENVGEVADLTLIGGQNCAYYTEIASVGEEFEIRGNFTVAILDPVTKVIRAKETIAGGPVYPRVLPEYGEGQIVISFQNTDTYPPSIVRYLTLVDYYSAQQTNEYLEEKQDRLVAGTGIVIDGDKISMAGGAVVADAVTAWLTSDFTSTGQTVEHVPLTEKTIVGSGLTVNNSGQIEVGPNITCIEVTLTAKLNAPTVAVYKNGTGAFVIGSNYNNGYDTITTAPFLLDVTEGDVIGVELMNATSGQKLSGDNIVGYTYLTVVAVEEEGSGGGTTTTAFFNCPFPTSWTEDSTHINATGTNTYGTWSISTDAPTIEDEGTTGVKYIYDGNFSTSHHCITGATNGDFSKVRSTTIECPTGVSIKPNHVHAKMPGTKGSTNHPEYPVTTLQGYNPATSDWENILVQTWTGSLFNPDQDIYTDTFYTKFRVTGIYSGYGALGVSSISELQITNGYIREEM